MSSNRIDDLRTCTVLAELNFANDNENWFYGARNSWLQQSEKSAESIPGKIQGKPKPKGSLFEDSLGCFSVYSRQSEAIAKCEREGSMSRIFAFEHSIYHPGRRRFLVSTVERFWHWYKEQSNVSFYELIPQDRPARLYFDLEFCRKTNPGVDEKNLIKDFNECVTEVLMDMFNIGLNPEMDLLVLDASTSAKFSEHIIVHLPDSYLFQSNIAMKSFIHRLREKMLSSDRCLVWNTDGTKRVTLCDTAVYSLNRNFRLYLSSKLGKNNPFVLSKRCHFYARRKHPSEQQIFLDSLVVPSDYGSAENFFHVSMEEDGEHSKSGCSTSKILAVSPAQTNPSSEYVDYMIGYGTTSPFPALEQHIISINRRWKDNASIRQWKLSMDKFTGSRRITYYISRCRYCFNIGREHRSNGVFWIVDLDRLYCFQKCFDVDCRGSSSNYFPLPNYVRTSLPSIKDLTTGADEMAAQAPHLDAEDGAAEKDSLPEELLLDLVCEAKASNEVKIQKRMQKFRRRSAALEMKALKNSESFFELTDDELLRAFIDMEE